MKLTDVVANANNIPIDEEFVKKIETVYTCNLPEEVKHILSIRVGSKKDYEDRDTFFKLANDLILEASEEMQSDFFGNHVLPIFDRYDNNYICYDYVDNMWCNFNTVDDLVYNKQNNISDLF